MIRKPRWLRPDSERFARSPEFCRHQTETILQRAAEGVVQGAVHVKADDSTDRNQQFAVRMLGEGMKLRSLTALRNSGRSLD